MNLQASNTAELNTALHSAQAGDTIYLAAGTYSGLAIKSLIFSSAVTITSADPLHRAVLTNFDVTSVQGLTFSNLEFSSTGTVGTAFNISKSQYLTFDHINAHGSLDGNAQNDSQGLGILNSNHINVTNSEFQQFYRGVQFGNSNDITVSGNNIHDLRTSGVVGAGVFNIKVLDNQISSIHPMTGDHPDAIQFFTSGTTVASHDILVADNVITRGGGDGTQGIFFRDQVGTLPFNNVTIHDNLVVGTGYGGIYVVGATNLHVDSNQLVSTVGKVYNTWMLVQNSDQVVSASNQALQISYDTSTHVTDTSNTLNTVVTDNGAAALQAWALSHGSNGALLAGNFATGGDLGPIQLTGLGSDPGLTLV
jgi:hypothetical protein